MHRQIVTQIVGRLTVRCSAAFVWIKTRLSTLVSKLLASIILTYQNVLASPPLSLPAKIVSNTKAYLVSLTTVGPLIKAALIYVQVRVTLLGQQLLTTVRQTHQRVSLCLQQSKDKLVGLIKSVQLRLQGIGLALTPMVLRLTQVGEKLQGIASQLRQRVTQLLKTKP